MGRINYADIESDMVNNILDVRSLKKLGNVFWKAFYDNDVTCRSKCGKGLKIFENRPEVAAVNTNMIMPWVLTLDEFQKTPPENLYPFELHFGKDFQDLRYNTNSSHKK